MKVTEVARGVIAKVGEDSRRSVFGKITKGFAQKRHFGHERSSLFCPTVIATPLNQVKVAAATLLKVTENELLVYGNPALLFTSALWV